MTAARTALVASVAFLALFLGKETLGVSLSTVDAVSDGVIGTASRASSGDAPVGAASTEAVRPGRFAQVNDGGAMDGEMTPASDSVEREPKISMNASELRMRIVQGARGTYISDVLAARDSAITRWPERVRRPLRVWIATPEQLDGWSSEFTGAVVDAFAAWGDIGIPVRFDFVPDSGSADVHVRYTPSFANGISGKTVWSRDRAWWLVATEIELAVTRSNGVYITTPQLRAIAMHEVGHLLGLDHSREVGDIMAERVHVRALSEADRLTARLIYSVPAGSLR